MSYGDIFTYDADLQLHNPLQAVDGAWVWPPSGFVYKLEDISAPGAGRTEDTTMHKKRIGQLVGLELEWKAVDTATGSAILNAFNPEYVMVRYLDLLAGDYVTAEFYVGNRAAPLYNGRKGLWDNLSFNLIKRRGSD